MSWKATLRASTVFAGLFAPAVCCLQAQTCTTQANLPAASRAEIGSAAFKLASGVQAGDAAAIRSATIAGYPSDFSATANLVHSTSAEISGETLAVTQIYLLDASTRAANDTADAEFNCPLAKSAAETDFSIPALPPGRYGFAMVEATGSHPWLLSFLLQNEGGAWKMAGFYPHRRDVSGHTGLWFWTNARIDAKAGRAWLAWLRYDEADQLLRPANFVSSTNLDRLRSEARAATPPALVDGVSGKTPLVVTAANGAEFRITGLTSEASQDGKQLNLVVHLRGEGPADANAETARNLAAGGALLMAHPELRSGFDNLWVVAEAQGSNPFVTEKPINEVLPGK